MKNIYLYSALSLALASNVAVAGNLDLSFSGLDDLGTDYAYEGWVITDSGAVSTGVFSVDSMGVLSNSTFTVSDNDEASATTFVLTIEPVPDSDPAPSSTHILAGNLTNGAANLTAGHSAALGNDFSTAKGEFILAAPSGASTNAPYYNGIWWFDPATSAAGLTLPRLPTGWVYEGWTVVNGSPISTGRFDSVSGVDSDGAGANAGVDGTPAFPGQDFVTPATDLRGGTAVISIEPGSVDGAGDNSVGPFTFKPLVRPITDLAAPSLQAMNKNLSSFPTGTASFAGKMISNISGAWYDPALAGLGFNFIQAPNGLVVYYYGYVASADGDTQWISSDVSTTTITQGTEYTLTMYTGFAGNGADFNTKPTIANGIDSWGTMLLTVNSCSEAVATLNGTNGDTQTFNLVKLANIANLTCEVK